MTQVVPGSVVPHVHVAARVDLVEAVHAGAVQANAHQELRSVLAVHLVRLAKGVGVRAVWHRCVDEVVGVVDHRVVLVVLARGGERLLVLALDDLLCPAPGWVSAPQGPGDASARREAVFSGLPALALLVYLVTRKVLGDVSDLLDADLSALGESAGGVYADGSAAALVLLAPREGLLGLVGRGLWDGVQSLSAAGRDDVDAQGGERALGQLDGLGGVVDSDARRLPVVQQAQLAQAAGDADQVQVRVYDDRSVAVGDQQE